MSKASVYYEVCHDPKGEAPFKPLGGIITSNKAEALRDLRQIRSRYPEAYLAQVTYTRCPERASEKGR